MNSYGERFKKKQTYKTVISNKTGCFELWVIWYSAPSNWINLVRTILEMSMFSEAAHL